jgi:spore coat protein H
MRLFLGLLVALLPFWAADAAIDGTPQAGDNPVVAPKLPVISLAVKERIAHETKVKCTVTMVDNGPASGKQLTGLIRFHGATSLAYPKKSFALTLDPPVAWLGMSARPHWVLNAAFIDRSLMRHKLSYDLFRSLSKTNAQRFAAASRFVEVNFQGEYHGVYLLMERVDSAMLRLHPSDPYTPQPACIYKAEDHGANFSRPGHHGFEQREPDPLVREYWTPLHQFNRFTSTATNPEFFDPVTGIASRLDLDNAIDFHLLLLLTSNLDGSDKNLIFARDASHSQAPAPRFFFAPWDYDATFGRNWESSRVGSTAWLSNHLFDRLLTDPGYRKKFVTRWKQLRERQFSVPTIHQLIDENVRILGDAPERNAERWRAADRYYSDALTFKEDIAQIKLWLERRTKWLDQQIALRNEG